MSKTRGHLIIVSAPSGGGKTTLTRAALEELNHEKHPVQLSISYTTRPARAGEIDGVHYHFVDQNEFSRMVASDEFLEHAEVFGNFYGTGKQATEVLLSAGTDVLFDIDWQGARQIKEKVSTATGIFILPPGRAILEERLNARGQDDPTVIAGRMKQAKDEMRHFAEYDHLIVNDVFETALSEVLSVINSLRTRCSTAKVRLDGLIAELLADE